MAFDYKKEQKDLYMPNKPAVITVPVMAYAAVEGVGDPNEENGAYAAAVGVLYGISYTIKMSYKGSRAIDGYFEYVVPPLEGLWWMDDGTPGVDYRRKDGFHWISLIRLPDFVTAEVFEWARAEAAQKKKIDMGKAKLLTLDEGLCVQCLHCGSYDDEPATIQGLDAFAQENGCALDFSENRHHHEIYLNDPRKTAPEKLRTLIRHPVRRAATRLI